MPATTVVVHEPDGSVARRIEGLLRDLPALLRPTRSLVDFEVALGASHFPLAIIALDDADDWPRLFERAQSRGATIIMVGSSPAGPSLPEAMERGACCRLPPSFPRERWRSLLERLIEQSQRRLQACDGEVA